MEKKIKIISSYQLEGVLTTPKNDCDTAFIIICGSGKGDMDGNFGKLKLNIYKQISEHIVNLGYSTLRYSKRGVGNSEGDFMTSGLNDFLEDLDACVRTLRKEYNYKKIILVGHSEGAILSTIYSNNHQVDGLILISGAGIALKTAMNAQAKFLAKEILTLKGFKGFMLRKLLNEEKIMKKQEKTYAKVENTDKDVIRIQLAKFPAKWMREHFKYQDSDILKILSDSKIPALIVTGTKDVQADVADLDTIESLNNPSLTVKRIKNMDHMLRHYEGEQTILNVKKQYLADQKKPLNEDLLNEISEWIKLNL